MAKSKTGLVDKLADRRTIGRWTRLAEMAPDLSLRDLRPLRDRAKSIQAQTRKVIATTEAKMARPFANSETFDGARNSEWSWRPSLWRDVIDDLGDASLASGALFGDALKIFHDCDKCENSLRQIRNTNPNVLTAYALRIETFGFDGSFLSLVVDLPDDGCKPLSNKHHLGVAANATTEAPVPAFVRLNVKTGPNTLQMVQDLPLSENAEAVFDLGHSDLGDAKVDSAWAELIFDAPAMNLITIHDIALFRRKRAEI